MNATEDAKQCRGREREREREQTIQGGVLLHQGPGNLNVVSALWWYKQAAGRQRKERERESSLFVLFGFTATLLRVLT